MASPQTENGYMRIANEIWEEIIRRDFSKRQKDIILFIWRLSYGCKKKSAYIPLLKDFELCGIGAQNIKKELTYLVECKVIFWNQSECEFSVNKDYERWQISPVRGWDEEKFKQLIHKNLKKNTSQNEKSEKKKPSVKVIYTSQNKKLLTSLNKSSLLKMSSPDFLKQEVGHDSNHCGCKAKLVPKDSIKDIKRSTTTTATTTSMDSNETTSFQQVFRAYEKNFVDGKITEFDAEEFQALFDDYGGEWLLEAMREAFRHNKKNLAYVRGVLKGYRDRGGVEGKKVAPLESPSNSPPSSPRMSKQQRELEELDRMREEALQRERVGSY